MEGNWLGARGEYLVGRAEVLHPDDAQAVGDSARTQAINARWSSEIEIEGADIASIHALIEGVELQDDDRVTLVWASTRQACVVRFRDLVDYFDDWWYPSSDDLWVVDSEGRLRIEVDHEEVVRLARRGGRS